MGFNRQESKLNAIKIKIRRARNQAKSQSPDMKLKHPDWCRDASKGNYTMLDKHITEECQKAQLRNEKFRSKLYGQL